MKWNEIPLGSYLKIYCKQSLETVELKKKRFVVFEIHLKLPASILSGGNVSKDREQIGVKKPTERNLSHISFLIISIPRWGIDSFT